MPTTHWFDELTKNVAGILASRAVAPPTRRPVIPTLPVTDLCGRRKIGNAIAREVSQSDSGVTLNHQLIFDPETKAAQSNTTVSRAGTPILKYQVSSTQSGSMTATTTYGADFQGAKSVTITSKNGISFHGTLDGRSFTITKTARSSTPVFADGKPAPKIFADSNLLSTIEQLRGEVSRSLTSCGATASALLAVGPQIADELSNGAALSHTISARGGVFRPRTAIAAPGDDWYEPASEDHVSCLNCEDGCNQTYENQVTSWECILSLGACVPFSLAQWGVCMAACNLPGGGCLPNPCGFFTTCGVGDNCFSFQGGDLCCPSTAALCNNVCCGNDIHSCLPNGSCGCTSDQVACGNNCCSSGQVCIEGQCCQPGQTVLNGKCCNSQNVCGDVCCDELATCADPAHGLCCPFTDVVCNKTCCATGSQCIDNACCPHSQICGGVCCPNGETCIDAATHQCSKCPTGSVPCLPSEGTGLCCAPNVDCCPGTCCKPGEICMASVVNGTTTFYCGTEVIQ